MHESADITAYKLVPEGTYLQIFIPGKNLMEPIIEKHMNSCSICLFRECAGGRERMA